MFRFLEDVFSLLDVRSYFSTLPLRFCLRWSSAGRSRLFGDLIFRRLDLFSDFVSDVFQSVFKRLGV